MECPKCHHECAPDAQFCGNCATRLSTETASDTFVGRCIDNKYYILKRIAAGGMGEVYLARQKGVGQDVAIKKLHAEYYRDKAIVSRFIDEARAYGRITHPNAVKLHDLLNVNGQICIVMEYVHGRTLTEYIESGYIFTIRQILDISLQLADALWTVHQAGIVHRDLKTENVMLMETAPGRFSVKILDFGIAKIRDKSTDRNTKEGILVGTPEFMSPEQCYGHPIDHRADIYSFGILMYVMVCNRLPFEHESPMGLLQMQIHEPTPQMSRPDKSEISPALQAVVERCMMKRPDDRYPSFAEVIRDLTWLQEGKDANVDRSKTSVAANFMHSESLKNDSVENEKRTVVTAPMENCAFGGCGSDQDFVIEDDDDQLEDALSLQQNDLKKDFDFSLDHGIAVISDGDEPKPDDAFSLGDIEGLGERMPSPEKSRKWSKPLVIILAIAVLGGLLFFYFRWQNPDAHGKFGGNPEESNLAEGTSLKKTAPSNTASEAPVVQSEASAVPPEGDKRAIPEREAPPQPIVPSKVVSREALEGGVYRVSIKHAQALNREGLLEESRKLLSSVEARAEILNEVDRQQLVNIVEENAKWRALLKQAEALRKRQKCEEISKLLDEVAPDATGIRSQIENNAQKCRALLAAPPSAL